MLLSYTKLTLEPSERSRLVQKYDYTDDGTLNRMEFCHLCCEVLLDLPVGRIEKAVANMNQARYSQRRRNAVYWKAIAHSLDSYARIAVPTLYCLFLLLLLNVKLEDNYAEDPQASMFHGIHRISFNGVVSTGWTLGYVGLMIVSCVAWLAMRMIKQRNEEVRRQQVRAAAADSIGVVTMNTQRLLQNTGLHQRVTKTRRRAKGRAPASDAAHHTHVAAADDDMLGA